MKVRVAEILADAILEPDGNGYVISVRSNISNERTRFSIAHELGHLALFKESHLQEAFGTGLIDVEGGDESGRFVERLCDVFAAELLMPAARVDAFILESGVGVKAVESLRRLFGVSRPAALRRLVELFPWKVGFILWRLNRTSEYGPSLQAERLFSNWLSRERAGPALARPVDDARMSEPGAPERALAESGVVYGRVELRFERETKAVFAESGRVGLGERILTVLVPEGYGADFLPQRGRPGSDGTLRQKVLA